MVIHLYAVNILVGITLILAEGLTVSTNEPRERKA